MVILNRNNVQYVVIAIEATGKIAIVVFRLKMLSRVFTRLFATSAANKLELPVFLPNTLADNPGSRKARKRVGRGPGSGRGKTSCRGHKGQG